MNGSGIDSRQIHRKGRTSKRCLAVIHTAAMKITSIAMPQATMMRNEKNIGATGGIESAAALSIISGVASEGVST